MTDLTICGVCGEPIVGGKGDYWHLMNGNWEMQGDDGHLAFPHISNGFKCLEPNCNCEICNWYCSCGCCGPGGACSEASNIYAMDEKVTTEHNHVTTVIKPEGQCPACDKTRNVLDERELLPKKMRCSCGCHRGTVKHCAPCSCLR